MAHIACGNTKAVHPRGEHHESVAQVALCHARPFGIWSIEDHERATWETFLDSHDFSLDAIIEEGERERAAEAAAARFYEEGTEAQQGQYLWEVAMDEQRAAFAGWSGL